MLDKSTINVSRSLRNPSPSIHLLIQVKNPVHSPKEKPTETKMWQRPGATIQTKRDTKEERETQRRIRNLTKYLSWMQTIASKGNTYKYIKVLSTLPLGKNQTKQNKTSQNINKQTSIEHSNRLSGNSLQILESFCLSE